MGGMAHDPSTLPAFADLPAGRTAKGLARPDLGTPVEIPWFAVRGARPGPTLLVTAGVHGAEYASIEAAYRAADTDPAELAGTLLILPIVTPPSFFARSIYVTPVDGANPNRVFPGRDDGGFSERLAAWLMREAVDRADAWIDLHGGDLIESLTPFSLVPEEDPVSRRLGEAFGLPLLIEDDLDGTTATEGGRRGLPCVLAEAGGQGLWPEEAVAPLAEGVQRALIHLGMRDGEVTPREVRTLTTFAWLRSEHAGLWRPRVAGGDTVTAGQELGVVTDLLGEVRQRAVAPQDGVALFAVSSLAINAGDPLVGVGA
jgi:hypothetical protein